MRAVADQLFRSEPADHLACGVEFSIRRKSRRSPSVGIGKANGRQSYSCCGDISRIQFDLAEIVVYAGRIGGNVAIVEVTQDAGNIERAYLVVGRQSRKVALKA